ncbi:MAG: IS4 family transposase [Pseudomonadales bacterium]|nr:IS4 family transposase [Pseudomonadales bacterium]
MRTIPVDSQTPKNLDSPLIFWHYTDGQLEAESEMDQDIANLKSTTFGGKRFTRKQITSIKETAARFSSLSRRELAHTICEHLAWQTPTGKNKVQSCLGMLESLEELGILCLPEKNKSMHRGPQKKIHWTKQTQEQPTIDDDLNQLTPISLQVVTEKEAIKQWNEFVDRHHYLGYKHPIGSHLRYFILDRQGRKLGCLLFSYAVTRLPLRDEWIGWQDQAHKKHLKLVINNNRFLVLPWVKVKHLASKALAIASRQLADDWNEHHGYRPVLLETFVDLTKFNATCYRAANWQYLGDTKGATASKKVQGKTPKGIYIYPLVDNAKSILINGPKAPARRSKKPSINASPTLAPEDPFIELWQNIIETVVTVANDFDLQWQKRKRVLNTLLIMLFIFRLVFSKNKQGYAITVAELWDQCRIMEIPLPQAMPVAASAFCNARAKLDESIFKVLHAEILQHYDKPCTGNTWKEHRIFAVDGSKINLPRQLIDHGYRIPSDNAHYPQGLLSCLYQLKSKIPMDFDLVVHADERKVALTHLKVLSENDVIVYDRGYFSYAMLWEHVERDLHGIFRIRAKASLAVDEFIASDETDKILEIIPTKEGQIVIREKHPQANCQPISLRLVKYTVSGTTYILGTTLFDQQKYTIKDLSDVYHSRWGIEELYKISKQLMEIEDFHGQSERGIKQELFAHFVLITLTRIFANHSEDGFNLQNPTDEAPQIKVNFKNSLITVARNIEGLFLQQAILVNEAINHILASISSCRHKLRPNRSYDRRSRKPIGKWKPPKPAKPIGGAPPITT